MITMTNARLQKAEDLLTNWAYLLYKGRKPIEQEYAVYTGTCPMIQGAIAVNKYKAGSGMTAKQTRNADKSKAPSGVGRVITTLNRSMQIDELINDKFSPRSRELLIGLFIPRSILGDHIKDKQIAIAAGFAPKRASEIKIRAIKLIAFELLTSREEKDLEKKDKEQTCKKRIKNSLRSIATM